MAVSGGSMHTNSYNELALEVQGKYHNTSIITAQVVDMQKNYFAC